MRYRRREWFSLTPDRREPPIDRREGPSFRDLYEIQEKMQARLEKTTDRLGRVEKAVIILAVVAASPKLGGPDAAKLVADVVGLTV